MNTHVRAFATLVLAGSCAATTAWGDDNPTIDQMYVGWYDYYQPGGFGLYFLGAAEYYVLSDDTSWSSGAGSFWLFGSDPVNQWIEGTTIYYELGFQPGDFAYRQTDYNAGDHSAQGELTVLEPIVLAAELGGTVATTSGYVYLFSNEETWYGEPRFNYYSAGVGDWVPYEVTYTLQGATFSAGTFANDFSYGLQGVVDFEHAIPAPMSAAPLGLGCLGWSRARKH